MTPEQQSDQVVHNLRRNGFVVVDDYLMPPRPWSETNFHPRGVLLHHTASSDNTSIEAEKGDVNVLTHGDAAWPPPKVQFYIGRTGRIYRITKGGANHAGTGGGLVKQGIPNDLGNYYLWGIECQDDGYGRDWPEDLWRSCAALAGELLRVMDQPPSQVWRHLDYDDDSGKVDTRYSLDQHRSAIRQYLSGDQEDVMQKEDWDHFEKIVNKALDSRVDDIANAVLSADVTPKDEDTKPTVRKALRKVLGI